MKFRETSLNGPERKEQFGSGEFQSGRGINLFFWEAVEGRIFGEKRSNLDSLSFNRPAELELRASCLLLRYKQTQVVESSSWRKVHFP